MTGRMLWYHIQNLGKAVRKYLAWESILCEKETLDLAALGETGRDPEAYC